MESLQYYLARQHNTYSEDEVQAYETALAQSLTEQRYRAPEIDAPKHRFLCYLSDAKSYLLHGSWRTDLTTLAPVRSSRDLETTGHEDKLLAASDAIWAMWFALLDKTKMGGLTTNTCDVQATTNGTKYSLYYFAVGMDAVHNHPYRPGVLYVLDKAPFNSRQGEEWATTESVAPLFSVPVEPVDFPYLNFVRGVDVARFQAALTSDPDKEPWLDNQRVYPHTPDVPDAYRLPTQTASD